MELYDFKVESNMELNIFYLKKNIPDGMCKIKIFVEYYTLRINFNMFLIFTL